MKLSLASRSSQTRLRERYLRLLDEDCQTTVRILQLFPEEMIRLWLGKGYKVVVPLHIREPIWPVAAVPAPSMLYRPVPPYETTCSEPSTRTPWVLIALVSVNDTLF